MNKCYEKSKEFEFKSEDWTTPEWERIKKVDENQRKTGVELDELKEVGDTITSLPEDWHFHP